MTGAVSHHLTSPTNAHNWPCVTFSTHVAQSEPHDDMPIKLHWNPDPEGHKRSQTRHWVATWTPKKKTPPIFRIFLQFSSMSYIKNTTPRISSELVPVNLVGTSRHWWVSMVNAGRTFWNAKIGQRWSKPQMSNQSGYPKHPLRRDGADHQIWQLARA